MVGLKMNLSIHAIAPQSAPVETVEAPVFVPDGRPTADSAALAKNTSQLVPLPVAPPVSNRQNALVQQSMVASFADDIGGKSNSLRLVEVAERVLKPYGVAMLPKAEEAHHGRGSYSPPEARDSRIDRDNVL